MRGSRLSVERIPRAAAVGRGIRALIDKFIDKFPGTLKVVAEIQSGEVSAGFKDDDIYVLRKAILKFLGSEEEPHRSPKLVPAIIRAYCRASGDPDGIIADWLEDGAPLGITKRILHTGIFPEVAGELATPENLDSLTTHLDGWTNYGTFVEHADKGRELLEKARDAGFCHFCSDAKQVQSELGTTDLALAKLGMVVKTKKDGSLKFRIIWDMLRNGVNECVRQGERVVLPRLADIVEDARRLSRANGGKLEFLVIDIEDAFHNIPVHASEKRFTAARFEDTYVIFDSLVFGSGSSPTIWGRYSAWLGRSTAAIFCDGDLIVEIYVDDPLYITVGTKEARCRNLTIALLWATAAGYPMAWTKAECGSRVDWTGATVSATASVVSVEIPESKATDLASRSVQFLSKPVLFRKDLRSYCGGVSFVAGLVHTLKAFLAMLWSVAARGTDDADDKADKRLPQHLAYTRQARHALGWLLLFFSRQRGALVRNYALRRESRPTVSFAVDASPWGIGGVLYEGHRVLAWFADDITDDDLSYFNATKGIPDFNTLWEALAILVGLRIWCQGTLEVARIHIKSDSMAALRTVLKLAAKDIRLNQIAREIALDIAEGSYSVELLEHTPGVANVTPDALSRLNAPHPKPLPDVVIGAPRTVAPRRDNPFWRTSQAALRQHL